MYKVLNDFLFIFFNDEIFYIQFCNILPLGTINLKKKLLITLSENAYTKVKVFLLDGFGKEIFKYFFLYLNP